MEDIVHDEKMNQWISEWKKAKRRKDYQGMRDAENKADVYKSNRKIILGEVRKHLNINQSNG